LLENIALALDGAKLMANKLEFKHVQALEELHLALINAILRKRKSVVIKPENFERYKDAIKATLPPFDFTAHGFASGDTNGKVKDTANET
jgi:hypothetical protein